MKTPIYVSTSINLAVKFLCAFGILYLIYMGFEVAIDRRIQEHNKQLGLPEHMSAVEKIKQIDCMAENIYREAGSEPFEGKVAVAQVTLNRVNSGQFASTVCGVVHEKNVVYNKVICQFSWYCDSKARSRHVYPKAYEESEIVARKVLLDGYRLDSLDSAIYYHADYVDPKWNKQKIAKIGRHIFYKG